MAVSYLFIYTSPSRRNNWIVC